jgi:penicillin-binding protein 2B
MSRRIKLRTLLLGVFFTLLFFGLAFRVYWVQVGPASAMWAEKAKETWRTSKVLLQERGMIMDRNGKVLAADAAAYTIAVGPKVIAALESENPGWRVADRIVEELHSVLGTPVDKLREAVLARKEDGTYLSQREIRPDGWKVDKSVKDRLEVFRQELRELTGKKNVGLYFVEEQKRYYPNGELAAHVLGYSNKDGEAVIGLEKTLDDVLKGSPGYIKYEKDYLGTPLPNGKVEMVPAVDGKDVTLTIDRDIQFFIEDALRKAYEQYQPISITAIAADPKTMDILGMASLPVFDPNNYWEAPDQSYFKNNAIQSVYEPGSTFKIVTLAAAVEEGVFDPNELYQSGSIRVDNKSKPIRDHNGRGWGEITFLDGLKYSSNVAFVKLGYEKLGATKLLNYIRSFGFGEKTGIMLPGELSGSIRVNERIPRDIASVTFGQGPVLVTPLQQVRAVAAVANGGMLMEPRLIRSINDRETGEKQLFEPKVIRQVVSPQTARKVGEYLETVVSDQEIGTGKRAYIPGYRIAGKTGTAQKVINGEYSSEKYVVSFIGYAPVEDPQIVLYVIVDEPQVELAGGGSVAAPIFREIMEKSLRYMGIMPDYEQAEESKPANQLFTAATAQGDLTAAVPGVIGLTVEQARSELADRGFQALLIGKGTKVLQQLPKAGRILPTSQQVYLMTESEPGEIPDMKGLSLRDAMEMCALLEAACTVQGEGYVVSQESGQDAGQTAVHLILAPPGQKYNAEAAEGQPKDGNDAAEKTDASAESGSGG